MIYFINWFLVGFWEEVRIVLVVLLLLLLLLVEGGLWKVLLGEGGMGMIRKKDIKSFYELLVNFLSIVK